MRVKLSMAATTACAMLFALPLAAADPPAAKANGNTMAAAALRGAWPEESLSGKITQVDPTRKLVVVETPEGIPFDLLITAKTRITSGGHTVTLEELTGDTNRTVSVKFVPERRGDVAKSIHISG
jgi:hypothetical protein